MPLFRFHTGSLQDSMKTVSEFHSMQHLLEIINKSFEDMFGGEFITSILIKPYPDIYLNYDERIGWNNYIVLANFPSQWGLTERVYQPVGFCNGLPIDYQGKYNDQCN